jgi:DNA-binding response OmpR family regulator
MGANILVAEDEAKQADLIRSYLEHEGHSVRVVGDGPAALREARRQPVDLLVLDVMLPDMDGIAVCRTLRAESAVAVLMLTARSTEDDLVRGLNVGADDYLTKPFSPRELSARVRALLRRAAARPAEDRTLRVGPLTVDLFRFTVSRDGAPVDCTPLEFHILSTLAAAPGRVYTRRQLLDGSGGPAASVTERAIDVHVMNLRRKLEDDPRRPLLIRTVYGVGYKMSNAR